MQIFMMMGIILESCYQQRFTRKVLYWWDIQQTWGTQTTDAAQKEWSQSNSAPHLNFHQKLGSFNIILKLLKRVSRILLSVFLWSETNGGQRAKGGRWERRKAVCISCACFRQSLISDMKRREWEDGFCETALTKLHMFPLQLTSPYKYWKWGRSICNGAAVPERSKHIDCGAKAPKQKMAIRNKKKKLLVRDKRWQQQEWISL